MKLHHILKLAHNIIGLHFQAEKGTGGGRHEILQIGVFREIEFKEGFLFFPFRLLNHPCGGGRNGFVKIRFPVLSIIDHHGDPGRSGEIGIFTGSPGRSKEKIFQIITGSKSNQASIGLTFSLGRQSGQALGRKQIFQDLGELR